jgi:hypothetical protein
MVSGREESRGVGSPHYYVGVIQRIPWPNKLGDLVRKQLRQQCEQLVAFRCWRDTSDETTQSFVAPDINRYSQNSLEAAIANKFAADASRIVQAVDTAHAIDCLLLDSLSISDDSTRFLDEEAPASAAVHPKLELDDREAKDVIRLANLPMPDLVKEAVDRCGGSRSVVAKSFVADRRIELIARILQRHPSVVLSALIDAKYLPPSEPAKSARELVSYLVGCAFGRWDVRAASAGESTSDPFDPVSRCSPGSLVGHDGLPVTEAPPNYPLDLPPNAILLDEPGHPWDLTSRVELAIKTLFDDGETLVADLTRALGRPSLRDYLRRDFFKNHLLQYTTSRRKAPIYWPLNLRSARWGVWVYAPLLSRETLYAVVSEVLRREGLATAEIIRLEHEREGGAAARGVKALHRALEEERVLAEEIRLFRQEAERIAGLGWEPDRDDGISLCAAPLADLFPMWNEPAQYRNQLRAGKYEWATVARWANQL